MLLLVQLPKAAEAQPQSERGDPIVTTWLPKDYGAAPQIWSMAQDDRGVLYLANDQGILEYDGVSWRLIPFDNKGRCASLAKGPDGRIYAGGVGDIGVLVPDSLGQMHLASLLPLVPEDARTFSDVWIIRVTSESVYFGTNFLFRWTPSTDASSPAYQEGHMQTWELGNNYHGGYVWQDTFYLRQWDVGLLRIQGDSLALAPGGAQFANERLYAMLPYDEDRALVGSRTQGLFLYDGTTFQPFETEADAYLQQNDLYMPGAVLPDGWLLNTLGGAFILERDGGVAHTLDQTVGLPDNIVISVHVDPARPEVQWLALNTGFARIEATGPFSLFAEGRGLANTVTSIERHEGRLYVSTATDVRFLDPSTGTFAPVALPATEFRDMLPVEDVLLVATDNGVYGIRGQEVDPVRPSVNKDFEAFALHHSPQNPAQVFVGHRYGLTLLQRTPDGWHDHGPVPAMQDDVTSLAETADGTVWAGTEATGVVQLRFLPGEASLDQVQVNRFGKAQGLPEGGATVQVIEGTVYATMAETVYRFDASSNQFVEDAAFTAALLDGQRTFWEDPNGAVWALGQGMALGTPTNEGGLRWERAPFGRFQQTTINTVYADEGGVRWFGGTQGLIRYDSRNTFNHAAPYPALIRQVVAGADSLVYGGTATALVPALNLDYASHNLRFEYAATSYEDAERLRFQTLLEGFDPQWSAWTDQTAKEYTNLPEGDYTFRVRAQNIYEQVSTEATYRFRIAPPWHRTWWAYGIYVLGGVLLLLGAARVQRQRLLKKEQEKARQREEALRLKNELHIKQIEAASLRELDEMRSSFFANITHEFRTPLTLILGQIETLQEELTNEHHAKRLDMAMRHTSRLQQLINQLLDVAKLEAGKMSLRAQKANIVPFLRRLSGAFESLAARRQLGLRFFAEHDPIEVYYEPEKLEKIYVNLVSNALKFTPDGGEVSTRVRRASHNGAAYVEIEVRDSGIGIPDDELPHIFDRFYQVASGTTRDYEGTGIGLALTKDLVELHGGHIDVNSKEGLGTVVTVSLPLGTDHLSDGQVVPMASAPEPAPASQTDEAPAALSSPDAQPDTDQPILLVVEDNADMRAYICEHLQASYHVLEAADGAQGFALAKEVVPDLIISDVMMPQVDGYALAQQLRADEVTSHIPIVMLTAKGTEGEKLQGLESGVDAYLTKPFSSRELKVRVRKLIEMRQQLLNAAPLSQRITSSAVAVTPLDEVFIQRLQTIVEDHLAEEDFQVEALCSALGVSERQLYRKLKALLDCTPAAYIRSVRLDRAKQLLEQKAGTVSEITFAVGYSNTSSFARAFREAYGMAPSELLKKP